ncbi:MAG: alpha/beta hydrolase [Actinomycetota bacterium]|nr:alpha/beta hydrolase [Actinomycetota bacterium]
MATHAVHRAGAELAVCDAGEGVPVLLLHGLTATHRYVVMGSTRLERGGHRVISYDARGHGASSPARDSSAYGYDELAVDALAVLDELEVPRAILAGASMGAHTLLRVALEHPERVGAVVVITPAYEPGESEDEARLVRWDALADGLRTGGVEGFVAAYGEPRVPAGWRDTVLTVIRQRLSLHEHPEAVADALSAVPRSRPFESIAELEQIAVPAAIVASADEADPEHPQAVGEAYAAAIPGAKLVTDEPGRSPVAWQGSQLSAVIADVAARAGIA